MKKTITSKISDEFRNNLISLVAYSMVNSYTAERVAFGFEKPGDKAPIDMYLKHLHIDYFDRQNCCTDFSGLYLNEQECIKPEQDYSVFVRDLFVFQMEGLFMYLPKDELLERRGEEIPLPSPFREYLFELLPLFTEVLQTKVSYSPFDVILPNKEARFRGFPKWNKFVTSIYFKKIKPGSRVNRYFKNYPHAPYFVTRLVDKINNYYYLKSVDVNSFEYAFALFSLMSFMTDEHNFVFEMKMHEWERKHKKE